MAAKITFEGRLFDIGGEINQPSSLEKLVRILINDFPLYDESFYSLSLNHLKDEISSISWKINADSAFNAFVRSSKNEIGVNLFTICSIMSIPKISKYINDAVQSETISIEDLGYLIDNIPDSLLYELDSLFDIWQRIQEESNNSGIWKLSNFPLVEDLFFFDKIFRFVMWHEVSHWNFFRFKEPICSKLFDQTRFHLSNFLREGKFIDSKSVEIACQYLQYSEIENSWLNEITADSMAAISCIMKHASSQYDKRDWYASFAMLFGLLGYYQFFLTGIRGYEISFESHPPVGFRQEILYYILSQELGMSMKQFLEDEFGAGVLVSCVISRILENYCRLKNSSVS